MIFNGIDIAQESSKFYIMDAEGKKVRAFSLENNKESFARIQKELDAISPDKNKFLCGMEATGPCWENLYCFFKDAGYRVVLLNPYYVSRFRDSMGKKAKTDTIDAEVIASYLRNGKYIESQVVEEDIQILRELTNLRYKFVKERKDYQRQIFSLLTIVFPEYKNTAISNPFAIASLEILKHWPTAHHIAKAKVRHIENLVRSIQGNNFDLTKIEHLVKTAQSSIYSGRAIESRALVMKTLLSYIEKLSLSITEIEHQIETILSPNSSNMDDNFPGKNLLSIPGVGKKTVAVVISYLGKTGASFPNATCANGYLGFYPKIYESGSKKRENKISKRGVDILRWALYMSAVACLVHNKEMQALYHKKVSQGKGKKQALICVSKKLFALMLSMLKSGENYNPARVFVS